MTRISRSLIVAGVLCICAAVSGLEQKSNPSQAPAQQSPLPVRISMDVLRGLLIKKVQAEYPAVLRYQRVEGDVVLRTIFGKTGVFVGAQLVSGDGRLAVPALKAVRQWQCKPYEVNGEPVEIEADVTFKFWLK